MLRRSQYGCWLHRAASVSTARCLSWRSSWRRQWGNRRNLLGRTLSWATHSEYPTHSGCLTNMGHPLSAWGRVIVQSQQNRFTERSQEVIENKRDRFIANCKAKRYMKTKDLCLSSREVIEAEEIICFRRERTSPEFTRILLQHLAWARGPLPPGIALKSKTNQRTALESTKVSKNEPETNPNEPEKGSGSSAQVI